MGLNPNATYCITDVSYTLYAKIIQLVQPPHSSVSNSIVVANLVLKLAIVFLEKKLPNYLMVMLCKSDPLYFLDIRNVYPRVEGLVVSSPLDRMLFNTACIACAIELGLRRKSDFNKLVIVKVSLDRPRLRV